MTVAPARRADPQSALDQLIGQHPTMGLLRERIARAAPLDLPVLIEGPTGSGKELVAAALHALSGRSGPFLPLNAAALPEELAESELFGSRRGAFTGAVADRSGLFAAARGGTLFLDEAGELPPRLQAKLLRVLESRSYRRVGSTEEERADCRLLVSTQVPAEQLVSSGAWRADFYYRLASVHLRTPPLAERQADILELANHFLAQLGQPWLPSEAEATLREYGWPGNVRELRRAIERAAFESPSRPISAGLILRAAVGVAPAATSTEIRRKPLTLGEAEREHITRTLEAANWRVSTAAAMLEVSERTLYRRIGAFQIHRPRPG